MSATLISYPAEHSFSLLPPAVCFSFWGNQFSVFS